MSDTGATFGSFDVMSRGVQHPNPLYDYVTTFIPRKIKSLFLHCDYLYYYCPQVFAALNKLALYPVTTLLYKTDNADVKKKYTELLDKQVNLRVVLINAGIDRHVYGNSFVSIHFPFQRFLECPDCNTVRAIQRVDFKFDDKACQFRAMCDTCKTQKIMKVSDRTLRRADSIHVIRWDPKLIDINANPITGEAEYYLTIPSAMAKRVEENDKFFIATTPMGVLRTITEKKVFKFAKDSIFHMRAPAPAGVDQLWGFPPLASAIKQFFHAAILRKANEAISLEYIVPFRILSPRQPTGAADPTLTISLANWVNEMKLNMRAWRRDPLHMMFSPLPVDATHVGGQGRALMVTGEIVEADNAIIASLGVPREFIYGGLSATGSGVTLRMIENQMLNYSSELIRLAQWITDKAGKLMGYPRIEIDLEEPKLVDDFQQKMAILQANMMTGNQLFSNTSIASIFGRDLGTERKMRKQESLDEAKFQMELQLESRKIQENLSTKAQDAASVNQPMPYNPQEVIAQADLLVQQFMQIAPGERRSQLDALQAEDYVMYSVVVQRLEQAQLDYRRQVEQEMASQQQGMPGAGFGG